MNLLYITPRFPYPPLRGDQAVPYYRLRCLSRTHTITLLSMYERDAELEGIAELSKYCKEIHVVKLSYLKSVCNVALYGATSSLPLQVIYYRSAAFRSKLDWLLANQKFDLIHGYMLRMAPYMSNSPIPTILELIDSMRLNWERRVSVEQIPQKWFLQEELRRVVKYERGIAKDFNRLLVVSEKDRVCIPGENVGVIPLGVDVGSFKPVSHGEQSLSIVFSGNMGYSPNICAVLWFVQKCLPKIQKEFPGISFIVIGVNPPKILRDLAHKKGVSITGFVKSIPERLSRATIAIAPMQSGSGMQFKILEAMACGLPVVTTSIGLGDIQAVPGKDLVVSDNPEDFAQSTITLLNSAELRDSIGKNARDYVVRNHSWEKVSSKVEEAYSAAIKSVDVSKTNQNSAA